MATVIRIAIDCMGGDEGTPVTIPAAFDFAQRFDDTYLLLVGLPDEIANVAIYLATDAPPYLTGEVISVSGGPP